MHKYTKSFLYQKIILNLFNFKGVSVLLTSHTPFFLPSKALSLIRLLFLSISFSLLLGGCVGYVPTTKSGAKRAIRKEYGKMLESKQRISAISQVYNLSDTLSFYQINLEVPSIKLASTYELNQAKNLGRKLDSLLNAYSSSRKEEKGIDTVFIDKVLGLVAPDTSFRMSIDQPILFDEDTLNLKAEINVSLVKGKLKIEFKSDRLAGESPAKNNVEINTSNKNQFIIILLVISLIVALILYIIEIKSKKINPDA